MKLYNLYEQIIFEEIEKSRKLLTESVSDDDIIKAIDGKYNVNIKYRDPENNNVSDRYIQVYVYGKMKNGNYAIRAYQIDGASESGKKHDWKLFRVDRIEKWEPTNMKWKTPVSMKDPSIGKYNSNGDNKWDFATKSVQATFTNIIRQVPELGKTNIDKEKSTVSKTDIKPKVIGKIPNFDRNKSYPNIIPKTNNDIKDKTKTSDKEIPQPIERPISNNDNNRNNFTTNKVIDKNKAEIEKLENELNVGTKTEENGTRKIPLTDEDKKRLENEINNLKNK